MSRFSAFLRGKPYCCEDEAKMGYIYTEMGISRYFKKMNWKGLQFHFADWQSKALCAKQHVCNNHVVATAVCSYLSTSPVRVTGILQKDPRGRTGY